MNLAAINAWPAEGACEAFRRCCGSSRWARELESLRPFDSEEAVLEAAERIWWRLEESDWLEAFAAHPRIGGVVPAPEHAATAAWSRAEQAGTECGTRGDARPSRRDEPAV